MKAPGRSPPAGCCVTLPNGGAGSANAQHLGVYAAWKQERHWYPSRFGGEGGQNVLPAPTCLVKEPNRGAESDILSGGLKFLVICLWGSICWYFTSIMVRCGFRAHLHCLRVGVGSGGVSETENARASKRQEYHYSSRHKCWPEKNCYQTALRLDLTGLLIYEVYLSNRCDETSQPPQEQRVMLGQIQHMAPKTELFRKITLRRNKLI